MLKELLELVHERLLRHSAKRQDEILEDDSTEIRGQFLAEQMRIEEEKAQAEAFAADKEAELAQVAEAMGHMDYMDALADSMGGGPGSEGEAEGEAP